MQIDTQKSRLENLFINDTIDDETVADIEKMLTRKKLKNFTSTISYTTPKEMPGTLPIPRTITNEFNEKPAVNCWTH